MKKISIFVLLAALFAPLAMNAQQGIVQQKNVDLFSMPRISLSELNSKGGDRATNTLLTEGFESVSMYENQYSATDWFTYNAGSGNNWDLYQGYAHGGSMCMSYEYARRYAADCYFVSEPFSVSASMAELSVSLWERVLSSSYPETFEVFFVRANQVTDLASVVSANHYMAIASASYTNTSYAQVSGNSTITALAGQSVRLVVHCTSAANMYRLMIDDITVTEITNDSSCGVATLPHFNGFENEAQYGCWTYSGRDVSLSTSNARTGSYCLRLNGLDDDQDQFLISPEFDGESAMEMSFYYRIADQDRDQFFYVGWGPDLSNISWDPIEIAHNLSYQEYTEVFPKGTKYIVIAVYGRTGTSSDPSYMLLDDITINGGCIKPRGLEADNITTKTVDLTWGDYSDNGYNVAYRTKTIASATLANTRFEDKFNSSSLSTSNWATQNQLYSSTATDWGIRSISGVDAYTGSYYASSRSFDGDEDHSVRNWLITKSMTLGNVVKFYMNENYPAWLDNVDVCVGTDNLTFVVVAKPTVSSAGWEEITIDLSKYAGQTGYIALVHEDEAKDYVCIDDFGVYTYDYTYTYGPWQYTTARSNDVQLTGLTSETTYEVQVQSICGENETSDWSTAIDFTTPSGCTAPIDLTADDITAYSANLSWSNYQDSYNLRYRGQIFYESFDRGVPSDWTTIDNDGDGYDWFQFAVGQDGTTCAASASYINQIGALTPDNWLVTPQIDLGGYLEMWVKGQDANDYAEHFAVYVSTTGNTVNDFSSSALLEETTTYNTYQRRVIDLTAYAGQQGYIAIRHYSCTDQYFFCVENFGIYKSQDWLTVNPNEATTTLNNLLFETEYVWQVQGAGCTNWSAPAYFTTLPGYVKHIKGHQGNAGNYYLIASPIGIVDPTAVVDSTDNTRIMTSGNYDLYYFDDNQELEWINYKQGAFDLEPGIGYLYANKYDIDLVFSGAGNTEDVAIPLHLSTSNQYMAGWNLVGNPYDTIAYLADGRPFYTMNGEGTLIVGDVSSPSIEPMEGVFVVTETGNESIHFTTTEPVNNGKGLVLNLTQGRSLVDRAVVRFGESRTLPKFQIMRNTTKVYIPVDNQDYAVVRGEEVGEMPVSFKAEENGVYTLSFSALNTEFGYLHLIDNLTGKEVDLLANPSYTFEGKTTDYTNRFKLVYATGNATEDSFAYFSNGSFVINNEGNATLQVIDVTGRIISNETISGCANVNVNAASGVYMLRLVNGDNVKVQKVVVR